MLRRLSSKFGRNKKDEVNGINGTNGATNGTDTNGASTNGADAGKPNLDKRNSSLLFSPKKPKAQSVDHSASRGDVQSSFEKFAQLIHASERPLPTQTGDGSYLDHKEPSGLMADVKALGFKDVHTLIDVMKNKATGQLQDDKTYLMEHTIQLVSALPTTSKTRVDLTNAFIDELWNSLQHPPMSYLGNNFQYRQADGSNNLGAANTPYARSVSPNTLSPGALPDPALIFDSVMARKDFKPHPNKVSSVFFYWASLIIHDLFQTDHRDFNNSQTSSYLDLSTLYGDTQDDQDQIRTFKDGKLKADCFSEQRLLGFPPGCGVLLIMLNRFHNYVVEQLAVINEGGRFHKPNEGFTHEMAEKSWAKYDEDLFQTGRLVTCGLYINITLLDYLRTIVNLNRSNTTWTLDPRAEMSSIFGKEGTPSGVGNQVSAEFNLAYRWHSCISDRDDKWTQNLYKELFGKEAQDVTLQELLQGLGKWEHALPKDPQKRPFAHLQRDADGRFSDDELVEILASSVEDTAGAFGPNNIPKCLKAITILGMQQSRAWNLGSLNEFRKFFGLKPHETFDDIAPSDPDCAEQLKHLYEHPDFVEMYPGMVSESAKVPMVPGVGIAPTFTISRAILSDAVALVRGDRFYTIDYNPKNLTNWGYSEVQYDLAVQQGWKIMRSLGREDDYSWDRPTPIPPRVNFTSYKAAKYILEHAREFNVVWTEPFGFLMGKGGLDFMLSGDTSFHLKQRKLMGESLYRDKWHQQIKDFYEYTTLKLLTEKSCKIAGINQVDITRDVGNLAHVHFAANVFSLPLKTEEHPHGIYSEQEMYMVLAVLFTCIFFDLDPAKSFPLRQAARAVTQQLGKLVEANVKLVHATGWIAGVADALHQQHNPLTDYGVHMFTQLLDYYLSDEGKQHLPAINKWAKTPGAEADDKLLHYAMEGIRLNGTFGSYRQSTVETTIDDNGRSVHVKPGDKVFTSFVGANREAEFFPDPNTVRIDRPMENYIHYGLGPHACLGGEASRTALTAMLRVVGRLDNLRRAPGPQGQLKKVPRPGGFYIYMRSDHGSYFPFPTTMKINWDGELPPLHKM
ncbi:linoleate 10R-lipoxygenase, partial [Lecanoromycetidae sp. Uapishka_2]